MEEEFDVMDYFDMVKKHWVSAGIAFLTVFGLVLFYTLLATPTFEAKSLVLVSTQDQGITLFGYAQPKIDLETQRQIILSPIIMYPVYTSYPEGSFGMKATAVKNSNVIEIAVETNDAENATRIADLIADLYLNYTSQSRVEEAKIVNILLNDQLAMYGDQLTQLYQRQFKFKDIKNLTIQQQIEQQQITREISSITKVYDYLLNKKEDVQILVTQRSESAKIMSYAAIPQKPVRPNVPLNLALGLILGAAAAFGTVFFLNQADQEDKPKKKKFNW